MTKKLIPLAPLMAPDRVCSRNRDLDEGHEGRCLLCEAPLAGAVVWVHMTTDLRLVPHAAEYAEEDGSQGLFPVGRGCARKVPKAYRHRYDAV